MARTIPPQIAEAVAGMELVGAELVDRRAILAAIETLNGESMAERVSADISKKISNNAEQLGKLFSQSALESLTKSFENSTAKTLANAATKSLAMTSFTKSFESSAAKALADAATKSQAMMGTLISQSALESLTKSFESSGAKALADAATKSQAMMGTLISQSALDSLTKSFESSGAKALADAATKSQAMMGTLISQSILQTLKMESQILSRVIRQMSNSGWLVPTDTRGWWEFAPGSRAGSFPSSNTFLPLIAALAKKPDTRIAVTMESTAFIHQLAEHPPRKGVIAVPSGTSRKGSLGKYRHVNLQLPTYATVEMDGLPVHSISGLLAAMAIRPLAYRDWPNVKKWLPTACDQIINSASGETGSFGGREGLLKILNGQPASAFARAAYFFRIADQTAAAEKILQKIPSDFEGPIYLGPRGSLRSKAKYDSVTKVYDNLIDFK